VTTRAVDPLRREMTTMVLYVAIVLLATVAAVPSDDLDESIDVAAVIWGAAAGLALAHWFAFHVASQVYSGGAITAEDVRSGAGQVCAALAVALVSTLPLVFVSERSGAGISVMVLAGVIAAVGYTASRRAAIRRLAAMARATLTLLVGAVVVILKVALGH
jgi:hypothetical protein